MEWVLFWLMFAIVVGIIANSRNRSGFGWFLLSVLITPVLALILVLCLPRPGSGRNQIDPEGYDRTTGRPPMRALKAMDMSRLEASAKGQRMPQKESHEQFKAAARTEARRRERQDAAARAEARQRARWEAER